MSIKIMQEVWEHAIVDQGALLVLLALADSADEQSRACFPGVDSLARKPRLSERQVQYCLQRLREMAIISVARNASPVKTNLYRIAPSHTWAEARDAIIAPHGKKPETQSAEARDAMGCVSETQLVAPKPSVTSDIEPSVARDDLFSANETPETTTKPKAENQKTEDHFERFWRAFPPGRKTDKPKAAAIFAAIVAGRRKGIPKTDPATIISGAERYAATSPDPQYVPMPATWLNGARWDAIAPDPEPQRNYGGHRRSQPWGEIVR